MSDQPRYQSEYEGDFASSYEARRSSEGKWELEQAIVAELLAASSQEPASVLDVPIGTGRFLELYRERGDTVVGVDLSQDMLDQASSRIANDASGRVDLRLGDITTLDAGSDSFDIVVCIRLLNLVDREVVAAALEELGRVSKRDVIVGLRSRGARGWSWRLARGLRAWLTRKPMKLFIHREAWWNSEIEALGAEIVDRRLVSVGIHRSGDYHIYLLRLSGQD